VSVEGGGGVKKVTTVQKKLTWPVLGRSHAPFTSRPSTDRVPAFLWSKQILDFMKLEANGLTDLI
jgi:hypothetical protein